MVFSVLGKRGGGVGENDVRLVTNSTRTPLLLQKVSRKIRRVVSVAAPFLRGAGIYQVHKKKIEPSTRP